MKGWNHALSMAKNSDDQWALYAKAHLDRTRLALVTKGEEYHHILQPSAEYLGSLLGVEQWTVSAALNINSSFDLFCTYLY
jgi:alpha-glucan,water dikinase